MDPKVIDRLERMTGRKARGLEPRPTASTPDPLGVHSALNAAAAAPHRERHAAAADVELVATTQQAGAPLRHKYGAQRTEHAGVTFSSRLEATRYAELLELQERGVVLGFLRQVPFHLPGDTVYRLDFQVFWSDGRVTFEDTKGTETESFRTKMRMIAELYPWAPIILLTRRRRR